MQRIYLLNWWLVNVLIDRSSKGSLTKVCACFAILRLVFSLIFDYIPSGKSQLIVPFLLWLWFLGSTLSLRLLTSIHAATLIPLSALIIRSSLQVFLALIDFNLANYSIVLFIHHLLWASVSRWDRIRIIVVGSYRLLVALLCIVLALHYWGIIIS